MEYRERELAIVPKLDPHITIKIVACLLVDIIEKETKAVNIAIANNLSTVGVSLVIKYKAHKQENVRYGT